MTTHAGPAHDRERRAAVIDVGSNTIHLLVAHSLPHRIDPIRSRRVWSALGVAVAGGGPLGRARISRVAAVVGALAAEARAYRVGEVLILGTHAVRTAPDREALIAAVEAAAGAPVHVLPFEAEAVLCLAGAGLGSVPAPPFLCADIGGGSCDLAAVDEGGVSGVASAAVGSGVLAARGLEADPPDPAAVEDGAEMLRGLFDAVAIPGHASFPEIVVTGGAARRVARQVRDAVDANGHAAVLLVNTLGHLMRTPSVRWLSPVKPGRAANARAGGMILRAILARWNIPRWRVSPYGLREGALVWRARGLAVEAAAPEGGPADGRDMEGVGGHHRA